MPSGSAKNEGGEGVEIGEEDGEGREKRDGKSSPEQDAAGEQRIEQLPGEVPDGEVSMAMASIDSNAKESITSLSGSIITDVSKYRTR